MDKQPPAASVQRQRVADLWDAGSSNCRETRCRAVRKGGTDYKNYAGKTEAVREISGQLPCGQTLGVATVALTVPNGSNAGTGRVPRGFHNLELSHCLVFIEADALGQRFLKRRSGLGWNHRYWELKAADKSRVAYWSHCSGSDPMFLLSR